MALKDVIKEVRLKKGVKQEDAASAVGVTVQTYSKWENGKTEPKASQVAALSEMLGISEREICRGKLNQKYDMETFMNSIDVRAGALDIKMILLLWRMLDDHQHFIELMHKTYKDEPHPHAKIIEKLNEE